MKINKLNIINLEDNKIIIEIVKTVIKLIQKLFSSLRLITTKNINIIKAVLDKPVGLGASYKFLKSFLLKFPQTL